MSHLLFVTGDFRKGYREVSSLIAPLGILLTPPGAFKEFGHPSRWRDQFPCHKSEDRGETKSGNGERLCEPIDSEIFVAGRPPGVTNGDFVLIVFLQFKECLTVELFTT